MKIDIQPHIAKIKSLLKDQRLKAAIEQTRNVALTVRNNRALEQIGEIDDNYNRLLSYMQSGADDPQRMSQYRAFAIKVHAIADSLSRNSLTAETPSLYYGTLRYEATKPEDSVKELLDRYRKLVNDSSLFNLVADDSPERKDNLYRKEMLERRIFNRLWVSFPLHKDTVEALREFINSDSIPLHARQLVISSLFLGLVEFYDDDRLALLWNSYATLADSQPTLALQAMTCAVIVSMMYTAVQLSPKMEAALEAASMVKSWESDLRIVFTEFVRSIDTERINRKMQQEVMPELLKLQPDLKRINTEINTLDDIAELEENPEWQEKLAKSGIADKLKSLSKIQEEGGDVFMSTFAHLKSFPFFNEIANWFTPFHTDHTLLNDTAGLDDTMANIVSMSPFLCDSDKFSFLLSLKNVPDSQRQMMMSQMKAQNLNLDELRSAALNTSVTDRKNIVNKYIQNLYRFFKLFRRKGEFNDPFNGSLSVANIPALDNRFNDTDTLSLVAEFYFKHHYYAEALAIFLKLENTTVASAQRYQNIGYCYQYEKIWDEALKYFRMSELLDSRSVWTRKNIAQILYITGQFSEAEKYYATLENSDPDNILYAMNLGNCRMAQSDYSNALKAYHKINYLKPNDIRTLRSMAWCYLMLGDFTTATRHYRSILMLEPSAADYINMGHVALGTRDFAEAINSYNLAVERMDNNREEVIKILLEDIPKLRTINVDTSLLPFIIDSMM